MTHTHASDYSTDEVLALIASGTEEALEDVRRILEHSESAGLNRRAVLTALLESGADHAAASEQALVTARSSFTSYSPTRRVTYRMMKPTVDDVRALIGVNTDAARDLLCTIYRYFESDRLDGAPTLTFNDLQTLALIDQWSIESGARSRYRVNGPRPYIDSLSLRSVLKGTPQDCLEGIRIIDNEEPPNQPRVSLIRQHGYGSNQMILLVDDRAFSGVDVQRDLVEALDAMTPGEDGVGFYGEGFSFSYCGDSSERALKSWKASVRRLVEDCFGRGHEEFTGAKGALAFEQAL